MFSWINDQTYLQTGNLSKREIYIFQELEEEEGKRENWRRDIMIG